MLSIDLPRFPLAHLPTPIEPMDNLSRHLGGPRLFVKRDDCTGLAGGGNKTRKLEFLIADALEQGADTVITEGGLQSNHCRQTAAAAARAGLSSVLVLNRGYAEGDNGNVLLDRLIGAELVVVDTPEERDEAMHRVAGRLTARGRKPYVIPTGGSNAIGAFGYVNALMEIAAQTQRLGIEFQALVTASGSGGTQGGLVLGKALLDDPIAIIGISDGEPAPALSAVVKSVAETGARRIGEAPPIAPEHIVIFDEYFGPGYGIPTPEMIAAVELVARTEGLLLDPVYSGKAMVGLIDLVERGHFAKDEPVLFLHTGGAPALFAYQSIFQ